MKLSRDVDLRTLLSFTVWPLGGVKYKKWITNLQRSKYLLQASFSTLNRCLLCGGGNLRPETTSKTSNQRQIGWGKA